MTAKELFDKMLEEDKECTSTEMMVEFAKLKVKEVLEKIKDINNHPDAFYEDKTWWIPQDSIIIDYFLKDIK